MNKALGYAFLLLKYRLRSVYELRQRLKKKGFSESEISRVIGFLSENKFIDDYRFACAWVESRLRKPLGWRRLSQELTCKGLNRELLEQVYREFRDKFNEEETIRRVISLRLEKLKNIDPAKARSRIFSYLMRRGFSRELILESFQSSKLYEGRSVTR